MGGYLKVNLLPELIQTACKREIPEPVIPEIFTDFEAIKNYP